MDIASVLSPVLTDIIAGAVVVFVVLGWIAYLFRDRDFKQGGMMASARDEYDRTRRRKRRKEEAVRDWESLQSKEPRK